MKHTAPRSVLIEGYSVEDILAIPHEQLDAFVFCGEPVVFRIGSAQLLGMLARTADQVIIELAQIDGGGEGALPALAALISRYAQRERLAFIEWRVHAVHCAQPNLKLRRVLERRGFAVKRVEGVECYYRLEPCMAQGDERR